MAYDADSRRTTMMLGNGTTRKYQFDNRSQLTTQIEMNGATPHCTIVDGYDRVGNRVTRSLDGNPITWTYDELYRLTGQQKAGQVCTYTMDGVGNLKTMWEGGTFPKTFTFNAADRLVTMTEGASLTTYSYTGYGALESEHTGTARTTFAYSGQDQLIEVTGPTNLKSVYTFDGDGMRRTDREVGAKTTTIVWDGSDYLLLNEPLSSRVVLTLEGEIVSCGVRDLLTDPLGSLVKEISAGASLGTLVEMYPYGTRVSGTGTSTTPFVFVGAYGYYTDTTDRDYVRARELMKSVGRWMQVDEVWPDELSFAYCLGNPVLYVDATGRYTIKPINCKGCGKTLLITPGPGDATGVVVGPPIKGSRGRTALMSGSGCIRFARQWGKGRNCICVNGGFFFHNNLVSPLKDCNGKQVSGSGHDPKPVPIFSDHGFFTGSERPISQVPTPYGNNTGRTGACIDRKGNLIGLIITVGCSASNFAACAGKNCPAGSRFVWLDGSGSSQVWGMAPGGKPSRILGGNETGKGKPDWRRVDHWVVICD